MGVWSDIAEWRGPTPNHSGPMLEQRGVVVHIAEGGFEGTISWCKNPGSNVSCHFVVAADGRIAQVADTDVTVWTQIAGNGHWLSVENEGFTPNALTPAQVEANAKILAKAHEVYGVPLQIATNPDGRGLGHHSMGTNGQQNPTDTWTGPTWGHEDCPGPAIVAQKPAIVAIAGGDDMTPLEHNWLYNLGSITRALADGKDECDQMVPETGAHYTLSLAPYWAKVAAGGAPVSGPVDLTDAAVAKIADAVVDEEHARLAE